MRAGAYPAEDAGKLKWPEDIMPSYLYLLSDDSIEVTAQRINAQ